MQSIPLPDVFPCPEMRFRGTVLLAVPARHVQVLLQVPLTGPVAVHETAEIGINGVCRSPFASPCTDQGSVAAPPPTRTCTVTVVLAGIEGVVAGFAFGKLIVFGVIVSVSVIAARHGTTDAASAQSASAD
jgi:hypothetical protein